MSSSSKTKEYTREEYVFLAKLYEKSKKYEDMVSFVKKFILKNPKLSKEEQLIFKSGYKNLICAKRSSWRLLNGLEKKEDPKKSKQLVHLKELKSTVEKEMTKILNEFQGIIDDYLLPNTKDNETIVFYLKLKADYYRYQAEYVKGDALNEAVERADQAYIEAFEIAQENLAISNSTRLGLALNFSVFYYEIKDLKEDACAIATNAFNEAMSALDELERLKAKDTLLIIQLLKENILLWNDSMPENEGEEEEMTGDGDQAARF